MKIKDYIFAILAIIKKNFKLLIRSRSSALVVILGPLLIVLLMGVAFNSSGLYNINVGVYSKAYSALSDDLITKLKDDRFSVFKYEAEDKCVNSVKLGQSHLCVIFPENMAVKNDAKNEIIFYADYSRINLVYTIIDSLSKKLASKQGELSLQLTETLVSKINEGKTELSGKDSTLNAIVANSESISGKAGSLKDKLAVLDLSGNVSSMNFTQVDNEISGLRTTYNLSSNSTSNLESLIASIKTKTTEAFTKLTNAQATVSETSSELGNIKTTLEQDKANIASVKASVSKVSESFSTIGVTDPKAIAAPFSTSIKPLTEEKTHLGNLFPAMIVLVVMLIAILLSSTVVMNERKAKAYFRNFITPTDDYMFVIADFITNLIIVIGQLAIIFLIANYFFKNALLDVALNFSVAVILIASVFILLGMILGYLFKTQETSTLGSLFVGSVLLFFSNTILPLESVPENIKNIVLFNPFVVSESMLRELLIFKLDLGSVLNYILILLGFFVAFTVIVIILRYATRRKI